MAILWGFTPQYDRLGLRPPKYYTSQIITASNKCTVCFGSVLYVSEHTYEFKATIQSLYSCDVEGNDLLDLALCQKADLQHYNEGTVELHVKHTENDMHESIMLFYVRIKFHCKGHFLLNILGRSNKNETFVSINRHLLIAL